MKFHHCSHPCAAKVRHLPLRPAGIWLASLGVACALDVDSELLLLVDVSQPSLNNSQFNQLMDGYATAFSSAAVVDSIQSGYYGRIAISLMFFGAADQQYVGIPWMELGTIDHGAQFAALVSNLSRPPATGQSDLATALTVATLAFGTETGGPDNGFQSVVQTIEVAAGRAPAGNTAAATSGASSSALASGVDLINSLTVGNRAEQIAAFHSANVIGSGIDGVEPSATTSPFGAALAASMSDFFADTTATTAGVSVSVVPEPSALVGLLPATLFLLRRRRRG